MKKIVALVLAVVMLAACSIPVFAKVDTSTVVGTVPNDYRKYYYTDSYFANDAAVYQPSFATMSYWVARCSARTWDYDTQYYYLETLLDQIGFEHFETNEDYNKEATRDTMGASAAYKTINVGGEKTTVLAIVPRSMNYGAEWGSNFTMGSTGESEGFANGASIVEKFASEYVAKYKKNFASTVKIWIAGYSRGAAVSNLVAGHFTKSGKVGSIDVSRNNIYAYTFETPACTNTSYVSYSYAKSLTNIHNVFGEDDLVANLPPENWGFFRYGVDEDVIPDERTTDNNELYEAALTFLPEEFAAYTSTGKRVFATETFQALKLNGNISSLLKLGSWKKVNGQYTFKGVDYNTAISLISKKTDKSLSEFWDDAINSLTIGIGSREKFVQKVQAPMSLILTDFFDGVYSAIDKDIISSEVMELLFQKKLDILVAAASLNEEKLTAIVEDIVQEVVINAGLNAPLYAGLGKQLVEAVPSIVKAILVDVTLYGGCEILSFIENFDVILNPHYPDQCASWLFAQDGNYNPKADSVKVNSVNVSINQTKTTKKVLFIKTTITTSNVLITPSSVVPVQKIEYRTSKLLSWKTGNSYSTTSSVSKLFIRVTDANGRVTEWEYNNGAVKKTK